MKEFDFSLIKELSAMRAGGENDVCLYSFFKEKIKKIPHNAIFIVNPLGVLKMDQREDHWFFFAKPQKINTYAGLNPTYYAGLRLQAPRVYSSKTAFNFGSIVGLYIDTDTKMYYV